MGYHAAIKYNVISRKTFNIKYCINHTYIMIVLIILISIYENKLIKVYILHLFNNLPIYTLISIYSITS